LKEWNNMLSEKELRNLAAEILRKLSEASKEGDEERAKHLMNAYDLVVGLLVEMEEKRRLWEQFLEDIKRVVEEPPRREGEGEEEIEERRRFARRLYEMAEEGLEEEGINPVREAIRAIRKATIELDPEGFREAALGMKEEVLRRINEVLSLLDEFRAAWESLTSVQVNPSKPKITGQASAESLRQAHIRAIDRAKGALERAREELEQPGLVELTEETGIHFRFWTGSNLGAKFASSVSHFVDWFVTDKETEQRLRELAVKIDAILWLIGDYYRRYVGYIREYERLSKLPPEERPKIEVGWWPGVWEEVMRSLKRQLGEGD
jgi:flagellin-specific chaperone FliS